MHTPVHEKLNRFLDNVLRKSAILLAFLLLLCGIILGLQLYKASAPSIHAFGWSFLTHNLWNPVLQEFGGLGPIVGTLVTSGIALLVGIPMSFGIAVFITELCPPALKQLFCILIELLAGIPSIIYGMWGLFVFAPFFSSYIQPWLIDHMGSLPFIGHLFSGYPLGIGVFTTGIILSIMVIPYIASTMRDAFEIVPNILKESAYALGATQWEVVWKVVLPYSRIGVFGGIILGLGRAIGETMAVAFVIGNTHQLSLSLMMPGSTISSVLANEFVEANTELYRAALSELGLILFAITLFVFMGSKALMRKLHKKHS